MNKTHIPFMDSGMPSALLRLSLAAMALISAGNALGAAPSLPAHVPTVAIFNDYDVLGRLVTHMDGNGFLTTYTYDANGNRLSRTDAFGRVTQYTYDALNRLATIKDPDKGITSFSYDALDHLVKVTDPRNLITTYTYDGLDNLLKQVSPDTGTTTFTQDAAGNIKTRVDARSKTGTWTYDSLNRVIGVDWGDQVWGFTWDTVANGIGQLGQFSDADGATNFSYDTQGRLTSASRISKAGLTQTVSYGWSAGDRLVRITYPSGLVVGYAWQDGVITGVTLNGQPLLSNIKWQAWSQPLAWTWANGQGWARTGDIIGRTAGITMGDANKTYTYDKVGNVTAIVDSTRPTLNQGFRYDNQDRLTNASVASGTTWTYTYDADGNRVTSGDAATPYIYPATSNRLSSVQSSPAISYQYDAAGNQTLRGGGGAAYDNAGRMIRTSESGTTVGTYVYNAIGQRVQKTAAGTTLRFMYDEAGHLLGEYGTGGAPVQETVYLGDWPIATVRKNTAGTPIAYYVWPDHLGTPRQVTDATSRKVLWRWEGGPFGSTAPNQDPQSSGTQFVYNLRFPGQYWDNELGRASNGFRDYDPNLGRYIESDPLGLDGGLNTYLYVNGNPMSQGDPNGLKSFTVGLFSGLGAQMTFGQNPNGSGFMSFQFGMGVGGGLSYDPLGKQPGYADCQGASWGVGTGFYAQASFRGGPVGASLSTKLGRNFRSTGSEGYQTPPTPGASLKYPSLSGLAASVSAGGQVTLFGGGSAKGSCTCGQ